jgi:hypothetical protein
LGVIVAKAALIMANLEQVELLKTDVKTWNRWRSDDPLVVPDLRKADLSWANLLRANLTKADLGGAQLHGANLFKADLDRANLEGATLDDACLEFATIVESNLCGAKLRGCEVYGTSVWSVKLSPATIQSGLRITREGESAITVDDLEVAQFVYLLLSNSKIRNVVDTVGKKAVLILGRFSAERKATLDAIRDALRKRDFVPILFDFEKPAQRDLSETVSTLAHLARFVIADITDAKSIPQELQRIIPSLPSLPVQPIILESQHEYAMFKDFAAYFSVLPLYRYENTEQLLRSVSEKVIGPSIQKADEIAERRRLFDAQSD